MALNTEEIKERDYLLVNDLAQIKKGDRKQFLARRDFHL